MSEEEKKTIIGPNSKVSIAMILILMSPAIWLLSLTYELKYDIAGLRSEIAYMRNNGWMISDMERYRFQAQIQNALVKFPDVQEIVRQRAK